MQIHLLAANRRFLITTSDVLPGKLPPCLPQGHPMLLDDTPSISDVTRATAHNGKRTRTTGSTAREPAVPPRRRWPTTLRQGAPALSAGAPCGITAINGSPDCLRPRFNA